MIIYHTGSQKGMIGMILIYVGFCFQCSTLEMIMDAWTIIVFGCQYEYIYIIIKKLQIIVKIIITIN